MLLMRCCSGQQHCCSKSFELHRHEPHTRREASGYWEQRGAGPSTSENDVELGRKKAPYVGNTGPLSIVVDASQWSSYTGGILSTCGTSLDHAVQVVGIDTDEGSWKVRNSWNTDWGEDGFIRLQYGKNLCDLASEATYTDAELM